MRYCNMKCLVEVKRPRRLIPLALCKPSMRSALRPISSEFCNLCSGFLLAPYEIQSRKQRAASAVYAVLV
jgi:hypothetical protein